MLMYLKPMFIQLRKSESATQTESGISKIISKVQLKNIFDTGIPFKRELHSRKIRVPEHQ